MRLCVLFFSVLAIFPLFRDQLLAVLNKQSLRGLAVKHTSLQVEVAAAAVGLDGLYDGIDDCRTMG